MSARAAGGWAVAGASLLWATTGLASAQIPQVSPVAVGAAAMGIGGVLQAVVGGKALWARRRELLGQWRIVLLSAVAVAVYPLAFYSSMRLAGVAVGTVVSLGTAPAAAALLERFVDGARLTRRWVLGAVVGVIGVLALAWAKPVGDIPDPTIGVVLGVVAGVTYAVYAWGAARLMSGGLPARGVMGSIFGVGGLLLLPVLLLTGGGALDSWTSVAVLGYLALIPMFVGYLLFGWGLARVAASTATAITLLEPAGAALLAVLLLGERLPLLGWGGIALLFGSLTLTMTVSRQGVPRPVPVTPLSEVATPR